MGCGVPVRVGAGGTTALPEVTISVSPSTIDELDTERAVFTVTRDMAGSDPLTVAFTLGGAATDGRGGASGGDYVLYEGATGTTPLIGDAITIPAGVASATFSLVPIEDAVDEGER